MQRLTYKDMQWEQTYLAPVRYTLKDGVLIRLDASGIRSDFICTDPERHTAVIQMPSGFGKITDSGYDQMACLSTSIPACDLVIFKGSIRVLGYPSFKERNGQEGLGLFIRDTMELDHLTGYPYSNMAAAGLFRGGLSFFGREGVTEDDIEHVRNIYSSAECVDMGSLAGRELKVTLEKNKTRITAEIRTEDGTDTFGYEMDTGADTFALRDKESLFLGFFAVRGCSLEVDTASVSVEYFDDRSR